MAANTNGRETDWKHPDNLTVLLRFCRKEMTTADACAFFGITKQRLYQKITDLGLALTKKPHAPVPDAVYRKFINGEWSAARCGRELGIGPAGFTARLDRLGLPYRHRRHVSQKGTRLRYADPTSLEVIRRFRDREICYQEFNDHFGFKSDCRPYQMVKTYAHLLPPQRERA